MSGYEFITCLHCGDENRVLTEKRLLSKCGNCKNPLSSGTLYEALEIDKNSSFEQIKQAYRRLAMKWHPDKNNDNVLVATARFKRISYAYEVLSNPESRKNYDATINNQSEAAQYDSHQQNMDYTHAVNMFVEEMYAIAFEMAFQNNRWSQISPLLIQKGCPEHIAETIARACVDYRKDAVRKAALKPFVIGLIFLAIGGIITLATYNEASNDGGTYLVAYGPIIFGAYKMLVALKHLTSGKVPAPKNLGA